MNEEPRGKKTGYPPVQRMTDSQRVRVVKEIFATITGKYDFLNHFLSAGRDIFWRRSASRRLRFFRTHRFLDVATGTGDMAFTTACLHPGVRVAGIDFVWEMLVRTGAKLRRRNPRPGIDLIQADALNLPFPKDSFDAAGIAFGIRNVPDMDRAFREMLRVVVPGGQVFVLEMTPPQHEVLKKLYGPYLTSLLPKIARPFSSNPEAYRYLADSIMNFPGPAALAGMMERAGMTNVTTHPLTFGITHLFIGNRPA